MGIRRLRVLPRPVTSKLETKLTHTDVANRIADWMSGQTAAMTELLVDLVEAESPTTDPSSQAGPQAILRTEFEALGYDVRLLAGPDEGDAGQLLVRPKRPGRPADYQLLIGHSDTVWDVGTLDTMPVAFSDGRLHGPGSFDMKGGLVQMVFALRALSELGLEPSVAPVPFINSDEEVGSPHSERRIARLARRADRALVIEPAASPGGALKTARKGNGSYLVTVHGKATHAGLDPGGGASAIHAAALLIDRVQALNDIDRGISVNVGQISGGTRPNVVPAECRFSIDFRGVTMMDLQEIVREIEAMESPIAGTSIELNGGIERGPLERTPDNRRLWEAARSAASALGFELQEALVGGGSDGNLTSQYTPTLDGLGPVGDGAHAPHEHVELDLLPQRAALLALLLLEPPLK